MRETARLGQELTPQQRNVALLRLEGLSHDEIAARLFISSRTVERHIGDVYKKTGAHNTMALFRYFHARGESGLTVG